VPNGTLATAAEAEESPNLVKVSMLRVAMVFKKGDLGLRDFLQKKGENCQGKDLSSQLI